MEQSKRQMRQQLEKLCADFTGEITRRSADSRVTFVCCLCTGRRHLRMAYARQFRPRCSKCGGEMRIQV